MCKVYEFPKQFVLPQEVEERLQNTAKGYVKVITESLDCLVDDDTTIEEYEEITGAIHKTIVESIATAIEEIEV